MNPWNKNEKCYVLWDYIGIIGIILNYYDGVMAMVNQDLIDYVVLIEWLM